MAKKKEEAIIPKLTPAEYWEWRTSISEMSCAKESKVVTELKWELMNRDLEIARLKSAMFRATVEGARGRADIAKQEYENMKKRLEDRLGISLNGKSIDDITYEIRDLEEEVKS